MSRLPKILEMPEAELAMAFTAPFPWGAVHVSEKAQEEFSLEPKIPVLEGVPRPNSGKDLYLVSSEQLTPVAELPNRSNISHDDFYRAVHYKSGFAVALTPDTSKEGMALMIDKQVHLLTETDVLYDPTMPIDLEEFMKLAAANKESIQEQGQAQIGRNFAHRLANQVGTTLKIESSRHETDQLERRLLKAQSFRDGLVGLAGVTLVSLNMLDGSVSTTEIIADVAALSFLVGFTNTGNKRLTRTTFEAYRSIPARTTALGSTAARSVHDLFCPGK